MMWFIALVFFVPGLALLCRAFVHMWQAWQSRDWPTVDGTIEESGIEETDSDGPAYKPTIRYTYTLGEQKYASDRLRIGWPLSASKKWAAGWAARYPAGTRVVVSVDPSDETHCVLERGFHPWLFVNVLFFAVFVAVGVFLMFKAAEMGGR